MTQQNFGVRYIEIPACVFLFCLFKHITIFQRDGRVGIVKWHIHNVINAQHIHGQAFQTIGQFTRNGMAIMPADLLEIGELADFHAVTPHFPAKAPGAQCWAFPVILNKTDVMQRHIDPNRLKRPKI